MDAAGGDEKAVTCGLEKDYGRASFNGQHKSPDRRACAPHARREPAAGRHQFIVLKRR